jgi:hypothetical protein
MIAMRVALHEMLLRSTSLPRMKPGVMTMAPPYPGDGK